MEKPILFSNPMIEAILDGRKTMTRRVMKPQPEKTGSGWMYNGGYFVSDEDMQSHLFHEVYGGKGCPYGNVYGDGTADRLWVRESWNAQTQNGKWWHEVPRADRPLLNWAWTNPVRPAYDATPPRWLPSIHMPRTACRIELEIVNIRVERLHSITWKDIAAEGCPSEHHMANCGFMTDAMFGWWEHLWKSINGEDSWSANPWLWVIEFRVD